MGGLVIWRALWVWALGFSGEYEDLWNEGKVISLNTLYTGQHWMGVIPFQTPREISAVRSMLHCWMWGKKCRLEQLMKPYRPQSVKKNYGVHKTTLTRVQIKGQNNINAWTIKIPLFSSDQREKIGVLRSYCRVKGPKCILGLGPGPRTEWSEEK